MIRPLHAKDRGAIEGLLRAAGNFTAEEVATALEVIDDTLAGDPDYIVRVLQEHTVRGYECHGPVALTDGAYDLYWIAVDASSQGRGYGGELLRAAERDVVERGGRLLLIETSSQPSYTATVRFYERNGYTIAARIRDFYRRGDDKIILAKDLSNAS